MRRGIKTTRITEITAEEHAAVLQEAITSFDVNPYALEWHYVHLAFKTNDNNVSETARALGMHRRTVQRILEKRSPPR
jgi:ActR/RegA family two-component response regulator